MRNYVYVRLLVAVAALVAYGYFVSQVQVRAEQPSKTDVEMALRGLMEQNMSACNEENMDKLLGLMSDEMPNREKFITTVDMAWSVDDSYNRIDALEVLEKTRAPNGRTKWPYAVARVRQTTMFTNGEQRAEILAECEDGQCPQQQGDLEHLMAVVPHTATVEYECLFKNENGEWKIVANVSIPVPVGSPPKYPRVKRSVF
jgi:hypothetical protein